jgi:hypothetical protein
MRHRRPRSVTLLILVVLCFTVLHWLRLLESIQLWDTLTIMPLSWHPIYFVSSGALWGMIGLVLVWGLWRGLPWGPWGMRLVVPLYIVYYWIDRLLVAEDTAIESRWPFAVGITVVLALYVLWVLSRKQTRRYFHN